MIERAVLVQPGRACTPPSPPQLKLDTINLCKNSIRRIEGLSHLSRLQTLLLAHNQLSSAEDVAHLRECPSLTCVDLQENRIDDPAVLDVLEQMPVLAVLYLQVRVCGGGGRCSGR